jgi:hypothetical protein
MGNHFSKRATIFQKGQPFFKKGNHFSKRATIFQKGQPFFKKGNHKKRATIFQKGQPQKKGNHFSKRATTRVAPTERFVGATLVVALKKEDDNKIYLSHTTIWHKRLSFCRLSINY